VASAAQRPDTDFERLLTAIQHRHAWLPATLAHRLARAYGGRIDRVLGSAQALTDLGTEVAPGLYEAELNYLIAEEWVLDAEDALWRRSKLGLHFTEAERAGVSAWFEKKNNNIK